MSKTTRYALAISGVIVIIALVLYAWFASQSETSDYFPEKKDSQGIKFNKKTFNKGKQQAITTSKFSIDAPMLGKINMAVQQIASKDKIHQKYKVEAKGLLLSSMMEDQEGGVIIDLNKKTRLVYDMTAKTFSEEGFDKLQKDSLSDFSMDSIKIKNNPLKQKNPKSQTKESREKINGIEALKVYNKSVSEDGSIVEVTRWFSLEKLKAVQKVNEIETKVSEILNLSKPSISEAITKILSQVSNTMDALEKKGGTMLKFEFSFIRKEGKSPLFTVEYNLLDNYFEDYSNKDFKTSLEK